MAEKNNLTMVQNEEEPTYALNWIKQEPVCTVRSATAVQMEEKKRTPRRILHFSDGTLEEYSTDDEEEEKMNQQNFNPSTLSWSKWMLHYLGSAANNTLSAADYCGEKLAWFFGVTSPKYQYILDEIQHRQLQEREEKEREAKEKEAKGISQDQMHVSDEIASTQDSNSLGSGLGYDNMVFHSDENNRGLEKF